MIVVGYRSTARPAPGSFTFCSRGFLTPSRATRTGSTMPSVPSVPLADFGAGLGAGASASPFAAASSCLFALRIAATTFLLLELMVSDTLGSEAGVAFGFLTRGTLTELGAGESRPLGAGEATFSAPGLVAGEAAVLATVDDTGPAEDVGATEDGRTTSAAFSAALVPASRTLFAAFPIAGTLERPATDALAVALIRGATPSVP